MGLPCYYQCYTVLIYQNKGTNTSNYCYAIQCYTITIKAFGSISTTWPQFNKKTCGVLRCHLSCFVSISSILIIYVSLSLYCIIIAVVLLLCFQAFVLFKERERWINALQILGVKFPHGIANSQ